mmetsp:Transcript_11982/g.25871  ORF Transcript_11982/g.25871 Transcript_11982/m.25871 type:complete len:145 (+) Transcript_11982:41-475(+)
MSCKFGRIGSCAAPLVVNLGDLPAGALEAWSAPVKHCPCSESTEHLEKAFTPAEMQLVCPECGDHRAHRLQCCSENSRTYALIADEIVVICEDCGDITGLPRCHHCRVECVPACRKAPTVTTVPAEDSDTSDTWSSSGHSRSLM